MIPPQSKVDEATKTKNKQLIIINSDKFQSLFWKLNAFQTMTEKRFFLRVLCTSHLFDVEQIERLLPLFELCDKMDLVEYMYPRIYEIETEAIQHKLLNNFHGIHEEYVRDMFAVAELSRSKKTNAVLFLTDRDPSEMCFRAKHLLCRTDEQVDKLIESIHRASYTSNQKHVMQSAAFEYNTGATARQFVNIARKYLRMVCKDVAASDESKKNWIANQVVNSDVHELGAFGRQQFLLFLQYLSPMLLSFTMHDLMTFLDNLDKWADCYLTINQLLPFVCDPENAEYLFKYVITIAERDPATPEDAIEQVQHRLQMLPMFPRSSIFGTVQGESIVFLVDTSFSTGIVTETNENEHITVLRLMVRELIRVLKEQLLDRVERFNAKIEFNIVTFNDEVTAWSPVMVSINESSVNNAALFLRQLESEGLRNTTKGLSFAFKQDAKDVYLLSNGLPYHTKFYKEEKVEEEKHFLSNSSKTNNRTSKKTHDEMLEEAARMNPGAKNVDLCIDTCLNDLHELQQQNIFNGINTGIHVHPILFNSKSADATYSNGLKKFTLEIASLSGIHGKSTARIINLVDLKNKETLEETLPTAAARVPISKRETRDWQVLHCVSYVIFMCLVVMLRNLDPKTNDRCLDLVLLYPSYITPSYATFFIWNFIFLGLALSTVYLSSPDRYFFGSGLYSGFVTTGDVVLKNVGFFLPASLMFTVVWLWSFQQEEFGVSITCSIFNVLILGLLYRRLKIGRKKLIKGNYSLKNIDDFVDTPISERLLLHFPISMYFSWVVFLNTLTIVMYFTHQGKNPLGDQSVVALILLALHSILAYVMLWKFNDIGFALVMIVVLFGVVDKNNRSAELMNQLEKVGERRSVYNYGFVAIIISVVAITILFIRLYIALQKTFIFYLYGKNKINSTIHKIMRRIAELQSFSLMLYILTGYVFYVRSVIRPDSCGDTAKSIYQMERIEIYLPPLLAISNYAFAIFSFIYAFRGIFLLMLFIPHEVVTHDPALSDKLRKDDMDLEHVSLIRNFDSKHWPWEWRITWRGTELLLRYIGRLYWSTELLFSLFILFFTGNLYWPAFAVVTLLFFNSIVIIVITENFAVNYVNDMVDYGHLKELQFAPDYVQPKVSFMDRIKSCFRCCRKKHQTSMGEVASGGPSIIERIVNLVSERLSMMTSKPQERFGISYEASNFEMWLIRMPYGLLCGFVGYLGPLMFQIAYSQSTDESTKFHRSVDSAYAGLGTIVVITGSVAWYYQNFFMLIGLLWALASLCTMNTIDTCHADTASGIAIRADNPDSAAGGLMVYWDVSEIACNRIKLHQYDFPLVNKLMFLNGRCRKTLHQFACNNETSIDDLPPGFAVSADLNLCYEDASVCPFQFNSNINNLDQHDIAVAGFIAIVVVLLELIVILIRTSHGRKRKFVKNQLKLQDVFTFDAKPPME